MHTTGRTTCVSHNAGIGAALMALSQHQPGSSTSSASTRHFPLHVPALNFLSNASISTLNPVPTTRLSSTHFQSTSKSFSDSVSPSESPSENPSSGPSSDHSKNHSENSSENSDEDSEVHSSEDPSESSSEPPSDPVTL